MERTTPTPSRREATARFHEKVARAYEAEGDEKNAARAREAAERVRGP